ncbi:nose resistant to fluoxetine protein 6-like isoform X2 [Toxorhynchites rutilus septentrionalis]|uniref:nose resistant to fluoxetine protein 6-like isoform X2 n=1 Tax=Toxorhynchites rutilus septentrionalis TaxID=329112 RepID=UPI002479C96D|nr:nose resistant to fluoxetine protein 6-like isoform X2 [Toxorhynchites rutilus septentrionalis]
MNSSAVLKMKVEASHCSCIGEPPCKNGVIVFVREEQSTLFDASAKATSGIEYGNVFQLGHFDQCMGVNQDRAVVAQYCLADVRVDGYQVRTMVSRNVAIANTTLVHWGVCLPASCQQADIVRLLHQITGFREVSIPGHGCHQEKPVSASSMDIAYAVVMLFFVLMVIAGTGFHLWSIRSCSKSNKQSTLGFVLKSFSVVENIRKLAQDSKDDHGLGCINGIKAVAMFFILGGHALLFMAGGAAYNPGFHGEQAKLLRNAFLLNSPLLVDTFLLLSGFLLARLLLIELDKRRGRVNFAALYVFRYIRLTPAYVAVMALYATWLPQLGSGPLWNQRMLLEQSRCQASWWRNVLYINNYIGTDQLCMFQSWYLAADTQLFVLAPIVLYPMWKLGRRAALLLVSAVVVVSVVIPFWVTYSGRLDPSLMIFTDEVVDLQANQFFANVYVKTHMRATAYVVGLLVGYLVHLMQQKSITIGKQKVVCLWTCSTFIGSVSMLGISTFYNSTGTDNYLDNALYAALHRLGWSLSNGWLVLACVTGHAGPLKKFLSSSALVPLSRLTYSAYLTNGLVELYFSVSQRVPLYASVVSLTAATLSHICLTFLTALGLCLMFESPIHGIEKIFLRRVKPNSGSHHQVEKVSDSNTQSTSDDTSGA